MVSVQNVLLSATGKVLFEHQEMLLFWIHMTERCLTHEVTLPCFHHLTPSTGNPAQRLAILRVKHFFLSSNLNVPSFGLKLFPLLFSLSVSA